MSDVPRARCTRSFVAFETFVSSKPKKTTIMFRTAVRRFAVTALRPAETAAKMEAPQLHGIEISKAQRIAHDGFIDGMLHLHDTRNLAPRPVN
jgi:hypothetical protein